jgi:hypothetical protein
MLRTIACATAALLLVVAGPSGSAAADPAECRVVSSSGRCLVAAIDPGRPGGPLAPPPAALRHNRPAAHAPRTINPDDLRRAADAAAHYVDAVRAHVLGLPLPTAAAGPTGAPARGARTAARAADQSVRRAVEELDLPGARIGLSATAGGFVGAPIWLWLKGGGALTGPTSATAAVGAAAVTATGRLISVEWTMGPPGARVVCTGPGTPWNGQLGASPDCGYVYKMRSLPERTGGTGRWPIVAKTHWQVDWQGVSGGVPVAGQQTLQLSSTTDLTVGEMQALVTGDGS